MLGSRVDQKFDLMNSVRAFAHIENVYKFCNADMFGRLAKTNLASNTAFRGYGAPQAMLATETMMLQLAEELKLDVDTVTFLV